MEARYGRNRRAAGDRRLVRILAVILGLALVAFIFWAAFGAKPNITGTVTSATALNNHVVHANVTFSNPSGKPARCQVSATLDNGASVGSKEVEIPTTASSAQQLSIVTVEPATGAVVDSCWTN